MQYAGKGIRCNVIVPGFIDTPHIVGSLGAAYPDMQQVKDARHKRSPTGKMGSAWDVARAAL